MGTQLTLLQSTVNILLYYLMKFQSTILCLLTSSKSTKNNIFVDNYFFKKMPFLRTMHSHYSCTSEFEQAIFWEDNFFQSKM